MQESMQSPGKGLLRMAAFMRVRLVLLAALAVAAPFVLWSLLPVGSNADPTPGQIQKKIERNKSLIGGHKAHERVLTTDISNQTNRINALQSDIDKLSVRQERLQTSLDRKRTELAQVRSEERRVGKERRWRA